MEGGKAKKVKFLFFRMWMGNVILFVPLVMSVVVAYDDYDDSKDKSNIKNKLNHFFIQCNNTLNT